jgi:hypothetical protein
MTESNSALQMIKLSYTIDIVIALEYLWQNCPHSNLEMVLKLAHDLCCSASDFDIQEIGDLHESPYKINPENLVTSLEFLRDEATRNELYDIEMILDSILKICFCIYFYQLKKDYESADQKNITKKPKYM